jgi:hypothetical protein
MGEDPSSSNAAETPYPQVGFTIGEYTIEEILGQGAMSTVFLCRDATGHHAALKVFTDTGRVSDNRLSRFHREIEVSKELRRHPNIMTVYATGQDGPYLYIAMAHLPGSRSLEDLISREHLSVEEAVTMAIKIARALAYAHEHKVVHRDVKPANILVDEFGEPILADLGVAALLDAPSMTVPGSLTGTPLYMAPEQAQGGRASTLSDLYSLGVVLYEMLTGVLPFSSHHCGTIKDTLKAVRDLPPRRPRAFREDISPDLEAVVLKSLAKDPKARYPDGEALAQDLERVLAGAAVQARRYSVLYGVRHFLRRHRAMWTSAIALALLAWVAWLAVGGLVLGAQYKELIGIARLKNTQYTLAQLSSGEGSEVDKIRALQEIHLQRNVMAERRWADALRDLEPAARLAQAARAPEVLAAARVEQARCAVMLGDAQQAARRYRDLLSDPATPDAARGLARLEMAGLALLYGGDEALDQVIAEFPPERWDGLDVVSRWLAEGAAARQIAGRADDLPQQYRNDAWFAAALRALTDGDRQAARTYLDHCLASSSFSGDWPTPLAEALRIGGMMPPGGSGS